MAVDMIFRLYLPLYALLKQTGQHEDLQNSIKKLILDEKAAQFTRNLMHDLTSFDSNNL